MLGSGIEKRQQQEAAQERELFVQQPATRQFALSRLLNQMQTERGQLESGRAIEDITTEARRGAMDTQNEITQRRESANRTLEQQLADIRRQEQQEELATRSLLAQREQLNQFNV